MTEQRKTMIIAIKTLVKQLYIHVLVHDDFGFVILGLFLDLLMRTPTARTLRV